MTSLQTVLSRLITSALFAAVLSGTWDAWWHGAFGRETFWSPPHIFLYTSVLVAISAGIYGWYKLREKIWKRLAIVLSLIIIAAPFDELWHRIFGVENISSPLIIWSPPHLILILAIAFSFIALLPIIRHDKDALAKQFFISIALAGSFNLLMFLSEPIFPTGPWQLLGFWGTGIISTFFVSTLLFTRRRLTGFAGATLVTIFIILANSIGFGERMAANVNIAPHDHAPTWLLVFSFLISAVFIDISDRLSIYWQGAIAGLLWGGILFGFSSYFFAPEFKYSGVEALIAIGMSLVGGLVSAWFIKRFHPAR